jgi:misacylated tRNA(Ala) deacylase
VDFKLAEQGDLTLDAVLSNDPFQDIEKSTNDHIFAGRSVVPSWLDVEGDEYKNSVRSRLLPSGFSGLIRVLTIDQVDKSTCCGTHVSTLSHLTAVKVLKIVKVGKNLARMFFVSGKRTMDFVGRSLLHQSRIANIVNTPHLEDQVERVQILFNEKTLNEKKIKSLWDQLTALKAASLSSLAASNDGVVADDLGADVVDKEVYKNLANAVIEKAPGSTIFLLSGGLSAGTTFYMQGDPSVVDAAGKEVAGLLGGRGGGKGGSMMGKIPPGDEKHDAAVRSKLEEVETLMKKLKTC